MRVGGTDLYIDWVAGGDATTTGDGPRYVSFQSVVSNGLAALAAAYPNAAIETKGMLWVQGERDAGTAEAANYEANLTAFIADMRLTYGSDLWFVVSRLSEWTDHRECRRSWPPSARRRPRWPRPIR